MSTRVWDGEVLEVFVDKMSVKVRSRGEAIRANIMLSRIERSDLPLVREGARFKIYHNPDDDTDPGRVMFDRS